MLRLEGMTECVVMACVLITILIIMYKHEFCKKRESKIPTLPYNMWDINSMVIDTEVFYTAKAAKDSVNLCDYCSQDSRRCNPSFREYDHLGEQVIECTHCDCLKDRIFWGVTLYDLNLKAKETLDGKKKSN